MRHVSSEDSGSEFERFYENYQEPITRYFVVKRGHEKEDADDYYQDIFLKILENSVRKGMILPQTDDHSRNWLYRIARNHSIDVYRHSKLIEFQPLPESESYTQLSEPTVAGHEDWICDSDEFQEWLAQLTLQQRECVQLKYDGLNQKQIAAQLGISPSRVSEILSDAETQLRNELYPETGAEASHARNAIYNLISGVTGAIDVGKIDEYEAKARDRWYRQYDMKKQSSKMRDAVLAGPADMLIGKGMYSRVGIWIPNGCYVVNEEDLVPVNLDDLDKPSKQRRTNDSRG